MEGARPGASGPRAAVPATAAVPARSAAAAPAAVPCTGPRGVVRPRANGGGGGRPSTSTAAASDAGRPASAAEHELADGGALKRPRLRRELPGGPSLPPSSESTLLERLLREVTLGMTDAMVVPGLTTLPITFDSRAAYARAFAPLLIEEARESGRADWQEGSGRRQVVTIRQWETTTEGWVTLWLEVKGGAGRPASDLAVLSSCEGPTLNVAGIPAAISRRDNNVMAHLIFKFFVPQTGLAPAEQVARAGDAPAVLEAISCRSQLQWLLAPAGQLTTVRREWLALHRYGEAITAMPALLGKPPDAVSRRAETSAPPLPPEITPVLAGRLGGLFNHPQLQALLWTTADAGARSQPARAAATAGPAPPTSALTLVQGPPGTGKTQCIWGMLNVLHVVHYQRYYDALMRWYSGTQLPAPPDRPPGSMPAESGDAEAWSLEEDGDGCCAAEDVDTWMATTLAGMGMRLARSVPGLPRKPRMLICAPSNIAVDVLLDRVIERGFLDGTGATYRPAVVRVSSENAQLTGRVRDVEVRARVDEILLWDRATCERRFQEGHAAARQLDARVQRAHAALASAAAGRDAASIAQDPRYGAWLHSQRAELMAACDEQDRVFVELARVAALLERARGGGGGSRSDRLRAQLEASLVNEAELVFATLSTAGQNVFKSLSHGFDTVLVDEAAQAAEVQMLPALLRGAKHAVLVGDPQQLPATVLSREAARHLYKRSLFERLASEEYRMAPEIREFPSDYFYKSLLEDGACVRERTPLPYHRFPLMRPYLFFDVADGAEHRDRGSQSVCNPTEARVAVGLLLALLRQDAQLLPADEVVLLTPYRRQLDILVAEVSRALVEACGESPPAAAARARSLVRTVDSFQGQERDVVIYSCVRTDVRRGVGFVQDIQRMNVALTRARRTLWLLGSEAALRAAKPWADLFADARKRGCFVSQATPALVARADTSGGES